MTNRIIRKAFPLTIAAATVVGALAPSGTAIAAQGTQVSAQAKKAPYIAKYSSKSRKVKICNKNPRAQGARLKIFYKGKGVLTIRDQKADGYCRYGRLPTKVWGKKLTAYRSNYRGSRHYNVSKKVFVAKNARGGHISRAETIRRAKIWYWDRWDIPYNQSGWRSDGDGHKYRTDCSGFVSLALHLKDSPNTEGLPGYGKKLSSFRKMKKGDYIGKLGAGSGGDNGHVRLFKKWVSKRKGTYKAYDFGAYPIVYKTYDVDDNPGYTAYRYKKIHS